MSGLGVISSGLVAGHPLIVRGRVAEKDFVTVVFLYIQAKDLFA